MYVCIVYARSQTYAYLQVAFYRDHSITMFSLIVSTFWLYRSRDFLFAKSGQEFVSSTIGMNNFNCLINNSNEMKTFHLKTWNDLQNEYNLFQITYIKKQNSTRICFHRNWTCVFDKENCLDRGPQAVSCSTEVTCDLKAHAFIQTEICVAMALMELDSHLKCYIVCK